MSTPTAKILKIKLKNTPNIHTAMGRQSKATKARHRNFRRVNNPQNLSVEDGSDDKDLNFEDNNLTGEQILFSLPFFEA